MNYRVGGRIGRFFRKSYGLLRGSPALYQVDGGVIRLRPWVPTNHGRDARYGDPPVVLGPSRQSAPRRTPEVRRVPAFLLRHPPTTVVEC